LLLNRRNLKEDKHTYGTATIDGQSVKVRPGQTILEAAMKAGIYIPTLCHLELLEPYGGCRLCVVEVEDMKGFPTACTTPLQPGMEVVTVSPALQKLRREILEFTLSEHPFTCLVCKDKNECTDFMHTTRKVSTITGCNFCTSNGDCELQDLVDFLELDDVKFPITYRGIPPVKDNPFYDLDYNLCILCGRCVRICNEERNSHVLAFVERGSSSIVGTAFGESQAAAGCEYCGACVDVCPTGSISEKLGKWRGRPDRSVRTSCVICPLACDMNVNTREGKLVQIGAEPGKRINPPQLCLRGKFLPAEVCDHPSRITTPLLRKDNKWVEVSWKTAIGTMAQQLEKHRGDNFGIIASAQDSLEDIYQVQKFTRSVMRSNNLDLHYSYAVREIPELIHELRINQCTTGPAGLEKADTLLLFGSDASLSHPILEKDIRKAFRQGKQVLSFLAYPNRSSTFSSIEILYGPQGEESMLRQLLSSLRNKQGAIEDFRSLEKVIPLLKASRNVVLVAGDELLRQSSSRVIIQLLSELQGILNSSGSCRILFPGFEGNLYAGALMGLHPDYLPGFKQIGAAERGLSQGDMLMNTGKDGIRAMIVIGDLPIHPGLEKLEFLVQCNMFRTELSEHADLILPLTHFLENEGHVLSMEHKIKKLKRAVTRPGSTDSISGIISLLARAMGDKGFSRKAADIYRELQAVLEAGAPSRGKNGKAKIKHRPQADGPKGVKKDKLYPLDMMILYNHFRYRGNSLSKMVPDLSSISEKGTLGLPDALMDELNMKAGDRARIISGFGELKSVVRPVNGLENQTACFIPNGEIPSGILERVLAGNSLIQVNIEKDQDS